jgi:hypothetical protein
MSEAVKSESEKKKEDWMNSKWRPMMGWMYMAVCSADFMLFPVLWSLVQAIGGGEVKTQWQPITLQGAGLFHIAMGAVLGIAAMGRTQEKLAGANNGGAGSTTGSTGGLTTPSTPQAGFGTAPGGFGSPAPASSGFGGNTGFGTGSNTSNFGAAPVTTPSFTPPPAPSFSAPVVAGIGGKKAPIPADEPEI